MRSGGKDFSLIEANVMFRLERVFDDCIFVNSIMIGINDVFFGMGLRLNHLGLHQFDII